MKRRRLCNICLLALLLLPYSVFANKKDTVSIYQGMTLKLDVGSTALVVGLSKGAIQHYEVAMNWRLKNRFYPTFELGYAGGTCTQGDTLQYNGHGGFFRVGCDINPLKKHPESPHALLIGVRLGTAVQQASQQSTADPLLSEVSYQLSSVHADCWGEIVAGCQVEIAKVKKTAFYMGWMGRVKCLFTRNTHAVLHQSPLDGHQVLAPNPVYIPGFGNRDNIGWGADYYLGWRF